MMCRLAKVTTKFTDTYENTVYDMLSFIYEDRYKAGIWSRDDWPLHEVNDDVDCWATHQKLTEAKMTINKVINLANEPIIL